jgi:hypothetical protein
MGARSGPLKPAGGSVLAGPFDSLPHGRANLGPTSGRLHSAIFGLQPGKSSPSILGCPLGSRSGALGSELTAIPFLRHCVARERTAAMFVRAVPASKVARCSRWCGPRLHIYEHGGQWWDNTPERLVGETP